MSNTKTEKYENISSRDYVPKYLKISCAETMSRLMGREYPAPKPFVGYLYILYFQKRSEKKRPEKKNDPKKKEPQKNLKKKTLGGGSADPPRQPPTQAIMIHNHDSIVLSPICHHNSSWEKSWKFSKCQVFPDIVVFRYVAKKTGSESYYFSWTHRLTN